MCSINSHGTLFCPVDQHPVFSPVRTRTHSMIDIKHPTWFSRADQGTILLQCVVCSVTSVPQKCPYIAVRFAYSAAHKRAVLYTFSILFGPKLCSAT